VDGVVDIGLCWGQVIMRLRAVNVFMLVRLVRLVPRDHHAAGRVGRFRRRVVSEIVPFHERLGYVSVVYFCCGFEVVVVKCRCGRSEFVLFLAHVPLVARSVQSKINQLILHALIFVAGWVYRAHENVAYLGATSRRPEFQRAFNGELLKRGPV
jgi:hypothetical protein